MSFVTALILVFALSTALANPLPKSDLDELMDKISSEVAGEMAQAAKNSKDTNTLELNIQLLTATSKALKSMKSQIEELAKNIAGSPDIAERLANKINQHKELRDALPAGGKQVPRAAADILQLGVNQIVFDEIQDIQLRAFKIPKIIRPKSIIKALPMMVAVSKAVLDQQSKKN